MPLLVKVWSEYLCGHLFKHVSLNELMCVIRLKSEPNLLQSDFLLKHRSWNYFFYSVLQDHSVEGELELIYMFLSITFLQAWTIFCRITTLIKKSTRGSSLSTQPEWERLRRILKYCRGEKDICRCWLRSVSQECKIRHEQTAKQNTKEGLLTMANPTSAFFRAGPSLVPSPVTATTCLWSAIVLSIMPAIKR